MFVSCFIYVYGFGLPFEYNQSRGIENSRMKSISIRNQSIRWRNTSIVPYMLNVDFFHQTNETIFCFAYWLKVNNFFSNFHFCFGTRQHTRILLIVFLQKIYNLENKHENVSSSSYYNYYPLCLCEHCMLFHGFYWKKLKNDNA